MLRAVPLFVANLDSLTSEHPVGALPCCFLLCWGVAGRRHNLSTYRPSLALETRCAGEGGGREKGANHSSLPVRRGPLPLRSLDLMTGELSKQRVKLPVAEDDGRDPVFLDWNSKPKLRGNNTRGGVQPWEVPSE